MSISELIFYSYYEHNSFDIRSVLTPFSCLLESYQAAIESRLGRIWPLVTINTDKKNLRLMR